MKKANAVLAALAFSFTACATAPNARPLRGPVNKKKSIAVLYGAETRNLPYQGPLCLPYGQGECFSFDELFENFALPLNPARFVLGIADKNGRFALTAGGIQPVDAMPLPQKRKDFLRAQGILFMAPGLNHKGEAVNHHLNGGPAMTCDIATAISWLTSKKLEKDMQPFTVYLYSRREGARIHTYMDLKKTYGMQAVAEARARYPGLSDDFTEGYVLPKSEEDAFDGAMGVWYETIGKELFAEIQKEGRAATYAWWRENGKQRLADFHARIDPLTNGHGLVLAPLP